MATDDDQRETSEAAARKRAAPTIDLDPSDVTDTTPGAEDASTAEPSSSDKARSGWRPRFGGGRAKDSKDEPGETMIAAAPVPSRIILAAVFSAAVVALLVSGLWNVISPGNSDPDTPPAQTSTIEDLNTRVTNLEGKPAAPADLGTVTKRLDALDASLSAIQKDVAGLREQMQAASTKIAALEKAVADTPAAKAAPAPDLSGIEGRVSKLEQQVVTAEAAKPAAAPPPDDTALRRALAASALDQAVQQGLPYAAALATASKLSGEAAGVLKPLESFAATGVPGADALSRELLAQLPKLQPAREDKAAAAGWLDHLRNSASRLVRVTRIDNAGADRAALLSRLKTSAERGDLQEAQKIVAKLPEQDRNVLKGWIDKVLARGAALAASRAFNQTAAAALSSSSH
jgi:hypothetical protein